MANLVPTPQKSSVYQIETSDLVLGGLGGVANQQAQQLLNYIAWLEQRLGFQRVEEKTGCTDACELTETPVDNAVVLCYVNRLPGFAGKDFTRAGKAITFTPPVKATDEVIFIY
jgi:hypothetical protein